MRRWRRITALSLFVATAFHLALPAKACGPATIDPIFVFQESPDLPFAGFTRGQLGIVKPNFGRKTLAIAYRYLNGGSFSEPEQAALREALRGNAPEEENTAVLKNWVEARKELLKENETLPEIYLERKDGGYDFFPNCANNAFEVATATLKDRVSSYGSNDRNVREWMAAQDVVFENCSGGAKTPDAAGSASPLWLRKDRDYQIAAAFLFRSILTEHAVALNDRQRSRMLPGARPPAIWSCEPSCDASLTKSEVCSVSYTKGEVELQSDWTRPGNFQASARRFGG
jgi:hypothetical protein